jgi:hypothetical protein
MELTESEKKAAVATDVFLGFNREMTEQEKERLSKEEEKELERIEIELRFFFGMWADYLERNYTGGEPMHVSDEFTYNIFKKNGLYHKLYREIVKPEIDAIVEEARWECDRDYRWESLKRNSKRESGDSTEPGIR